MKQFPYAPPKCEYDNYLTAGIMLAGSELTDDGAGDFILPGEEFDL